jgi:hypothetical protein
MRGTKPDPSAARQITETRRLWRGIMFGQNEVVLPGRCEASDYRIRLRSNGSSYCRILTRLPVLSDKGFR